MSLILRLFANGAAATLLVQVTIVVVASGALSPQAAYGESIPLRSEGGTFVVPVLINDKITLDFTLDSGASDVSIPADVFSTLTRSGTVSKSDFLDIQVYELADGSRQTSQRFRIRSLRIGSFELRNVIASVAPSAGTLLLGQSFLSRLKSWSIDNDRQLLVFNESTNSDVAHTAARPGLRTGTGIAHASPLSSPPIATDLHAAYCTEYIRYLNGLAESMLDNSAASNRRGDAYSTVPSVDDTASMRTSKAKHEATMRRVKADLASRKAILIKLNRYLQSRLTYPDLLTAQEAAKNDIARLNALGTSGACSEFAAPDMDTRWNECVARAIPDFPSIKKQRAACQNLVGLTPTERASLEPN